MRLFYLILCFPFVLLSQTQIGDDIDGKNPGEQSGWSVSLSSDGGIVAIGAYTNASNGANSGEVRVFTKQLGEWFQLGQNLNGDNGGDEFGISVSISEDGNVLAVGAPNNDGNGNNSGQVKIFENQSASWVQVGDDILGQSFFNLFGESVSLSADGTVVAVGAPFNSDNGTVAGHVRVFENQSGSWVQIGDAIEGEAAEDFSGTAVSISANGNVVAVGAPNNNGNGNDSGHVRVFENQSGSWVQIGGDIDGSAPRDEFGSAISLSSDGGIVAIGGTLNDTNGGNSGQVKVFENQSGNWVQIGSDINGVAGADLCGWSLELSSNGEILAVSSPGNASSRGHVRIYENQSGNWVQVGNSINGEATGDFSGRSVSLSADGKTVAIGANRNNSDAGHVRVYDLSSVLASDEFVLNSFSLYPNPAKDVFTIDLKEGFQLEQVTIYNQLGQLIGSYKSNIIKTSHLESGLYLVQIETSEAKATKRLLIK